MKFSIQLFLILTPFLINAQVIEDDFKFLKEFSVYYSELTSNDQIDWSNYKIRKSEFDKKLRHLISNKNSLLEKYLHILTDQEKIKLNQIFEKHSQSNYSNIELANELMSWKLDPKFFIKQNTLIELFSMLDDLREESNAVNSTSEDLVLMFQFESRLEETVGLINKLN